MRLGVGVALLVACSSKSEDKPTPIAKRDVAPLPEPEKPRVDPPRPPAPSQARTVRWSNVTRTEGCFFFSGPDGRDDQLVGDVVVETVEREGASIKLRIGTATFDGTYESGELSLARKSKYDYNGPWQTTETIRGRLVDGVLAANYAYEECELAVNQCPGHCTVTGTLTFARGL